ncbi:hypothetical protein EKPJFOCH_0273 [Methylobacterium thuringiense]|uniref:Uncharacterized protein n=1 Tax=Methylobacterium thuringiense TaxID=1003091 RepID=A0ABQ4TIG5_9HYPH|nr:hypothetical protein EKPJFOCH_0273 [Methylobacterium thuringiense]
MKRKTQVALLLMASASPVLGQSGFQVIQGTRVYTSIDQARGVATFSNDCGSQVLTQRQLQGGAIPDDIIPCPRPTPSPSSEPNSSPADDPSPPLREANVISQRSCISLSENLIRRIKSPTEEIKQSELKQSLVKLRSLCSDGGRSDLYDQLQALVKISPVVRGPTKRATPSDEGGSDLGKCVELIVGGRSAAQFPYKVRNSCPESAVYYVYECDRDYSSGKKEDICKETKGFIGSKSETFLQYSYDRPKLTKVCNKAGQCFKPVFDGS